MISTGDMAPDFTLPRTGGGTVTLSGLRPKPVVLFAYGKDGSPTCTTAVMDFDALLPAFAALGVEVLGLSKDPVKSHDRFAARQGLSVPLLSDHRGQVMQDWGLFGEKLFFGKRVQGVLRATLLIGGDGRVLQRWKVDKVKDHADEVLAHVKALQDGIAPNSL